MTTLDQFSKDVLQELDNLVMLGADVPFKTYEMAADLEVIAEYVDMKVSECVDLLITLGGMK